MTQSPVRAALEDSESVRSSPGSRVFSGIVHLLIMAQQCCCQKPLAVRIEETDALSRTSDADVPIYEPA
jgi:hypothetical protein